MERRLDELHRHLQQQRHAQAAGADARDRQPDDPDDGADDGDEDGDEREGQAQQPPERPAPAVAVAIASASAAAAAHLLLSSPFPPEELARMRADDEGWSETRIGYAAAAGWLAGWCASLWLGVRDEVVLRVPAGISIKGGRRRHWTVPRSLSGARREGKRASSSLWIYPAAEYRSPKCAATCKRENNQLGIIVGQ